MYKKAEQTRNEDIWGLIICLKEDNFSYDQASLLVQSVFKLSDKDINASMKKYLNE